MDHVSCEQLRVQRSKFGLRVTLMGVEDVNNCVWRLWPVG